MTDGPPLKVKSFENERAVKAQWVFHRHAEGVAIDAAVGPAFLAAMAGDAVTAFGRAAV